MKITGITAFCICLSVAMYAQRKDVSDSLYYYAQEQNEIKMAYTSATQLSVVKLARTGIISLDITQETGKYRRGQQAEKTNDAAFYTEGTARLGRFNMAGVFRFSKMWEDSLAYSLKGPGDDLSPYYYYAARPGNYNSQLYNMKAIVSYHLQKEKIFISTGIDYDYRWTTRSVDPRPNVNRFRLLLSPEITYRIKRHTIGAGMTWGYGNETTTVVIKNFNDGYNQANPRTIVYLNRGYGNIINLRRAWQRFNDYQGISVSYAGEWERLQLRAVAGWMHMKERNEYNSSANSSSGNIYKTFSIWKKSDYTVQLLAMYRSPTFTQQFKLDGGYTRGLDKDEYEVFASNYSLRKKHIDATWLIRKSTKRKVEKEWGLQLAFDDRQQTDALAAHIVHYSYIQPGINGTIYANAGKGNRIYAGLRPAVRFPLQQSLAVPLTQENGFTQGVVYPDYYYWATTAMITHLDAGWTMPAAPGKLKMGVSANIRLENNLQQPEIIHNTAFVPGNNRLFMRLAVNLYL